MKVKKALIVTGIVVPTFAVSFTCGAYSMQRVIQKRMGSFKELMSNALTSIVEKAFADGMTEEQLRDLITTEMTFIQMTVNI